jgi:histidine kinase/DNA gyrase B/HSP90-like ATPase
MFLGQTLINSLRDLGYNHTTSAVCEPVDNGIQWKATEIRVYFNQHGNSVDSPVDVLIVDNGVGMAPNILKLAMAFGGSMVFNDRAGIGRYGMGMKTAALSMGPVVEVYSWQEPKAFYNMILDVEEVGNSRSNLVELPEPTLSSELPQEIVNILTRPMVYPKDKASQQLLTDTQERLMETLGRSGTIIYIPNCDRLTYKRAQTLAEHATKEMARVYRKKISEGLKLFINNRLVEAFDPTFWMGDARHIRIAGLGTTRSRLINSWHTIQIPIIEGSSEKHPVAVRLYALPFEEWMKLPQKVLKNDLQIFEQHSVSFMRNDREVHIGSVPELSGKIHSDKFWFRLQIDFTGELDEAFGVAANKQGVRPKKYVYEIIKAEISEDISRIREKVKQFRTQDADKDSKKTLNEAEKRASETDGLQTKQLPAPAPRTPEEERALEDNLRAFAITLKRADETDEQALERVKKSKYLMVFRYDEYWPFYHVDFKFQKVILTINTAHPFFTKLYAPLSKLARLGPTAGDDEIEGTPDPEHSELLVTLQLLLLSLARTQSVMCADEDPAKLHLFEAFRKEWSSSLQTHLMSH